MKKIVLASITLVLISFVSCKKEYNCTCIENYDLKTTTIKAINKSKAISKCGGVDLGFGGVTCTVN